MWVRITGYFLRGLITLLPLFITIWLLWVIFSFADGIFGGFITLLFGRPLPGIGFLIMAILIFMVGYLTTHIFGEKIFRWFEWLLTRVPVIKSIYTSVKQVNDVLFLEKDKTLYRRACLVEYPRKGIYSVGFVTADAAEEIEKKIGEKLVSIFIPNTPTPATGFMIVVPATDVILLDMKLDDAFKLIVSGGVLKPSHVETS